eukprot:359990-Chlamydomonas_euryale.AAC.11
MMRSMTVSLILLPSVRPVPVTKIDRSGSVIEDAFETCTLSLHMTQGLRSLATSLGCTPSAPSSALHSRSACMNTTSAGMHLPVQQLHSLPGKLRLQAGIVASLVLHGQVVCRQALACLGKPRPLRGGPVGEDLDNAHIGCWGVAFAMFDVGGVLQACPWHRMHLGHVISAMSV